MELFDTTFLLSLHCLKLGMVQFYEGAKSWNGAVSWYSKSWNGAIIEKNSNICEEKYNMICIAKQPAELLCLRAALFYLFPLDCGRWF